MQILLHGPDGPAWAPRLRADVADVTVETSMTEDEEIGRAHV